MRVKDFIETLKLAQSQKTLYVLGCFGAPMTDKNKKRYSNPKNKVRWSQIAAATPNTFGFDCVCLVKASLGGWHADLNDVYGGTIVNKEVKGISYGKDHIPDFGANAAMNYCTEVSTDFSHVEAGELLWMEGHVGVAIDDKGTVIESTSKWDSKVLISYIKELNPNQRYVRKWKKHGKLKWVDYTREEKVETPVVPETPVTEYKNDKLVWDMLMAEIGNPYGVAGLMGNLNEESGLRSNNLQNSSNNRIGISDEQFTAEVDAGIRPFVGNGGYGIAQWTSDGRQTKLEEKVHEKGVSIADLRTQVEFLIWELRTTYNLTLEVLKNAKSVEEASTRVLIYYEAPASKLQKSTQERRAKAGQAIFDRFANGWVAPEIVEVPEPTLKEVKAIKAAACRYDALAGTYVTTANLHIRDGAGTENKSLAVLPRGTKVKNYGFYTPNGGKRWLYVVAELKGVRYTGYCSESYLKKG